MSSNAIVFYSAFQKRIREWFVDYPESSMVYKKSKEYTKVINEKQTEYGKGIVHQAIMDTFGERIEINNEYLRVDVIGWTAQPNHGEMDKASKLKKYLWDLEIAVEHENDSTDWMDELVKLLHIRCPLKVVVGYSMVSKDYNRVVQDEKALDTAIKCMNHIDAFKETADRDEILIVLGNAGYDFDKPDYRGYLYNYDLKKFERL